MPPAAPIRKDATKLVLHSLLEVLPLHAEEGPLREVIPEPTLAGHVRAACGKGCNTDAALGLARRLLVALGVLDAAELAKGQWAFVSFPASLLARSVLETLATPGAGFFEDSYWVQGLHRPEDVVEEQRQLLRRLEAQRLEADTNSPPNPIRSVHVAWGIIRFGNKFLLRGREDRKRPEFRAFVFPGGRLDPTTDLPKANRTPASLRDLFRSDSKLAADALSSTLVRELREELGLTPRDYVVSGQRRLSSFRMLEGTRNNHAYTEYGIGLASVRLTRDGELRVLDWVADAPEQWAWFTAEELAAGRRSDGATAFVDALTATFGTQAADFLLHEIPDSSTTMPVYSVDDDAAVLPARPSQPLLRGLAGREKPVEFSPSAEQWELLMLLAWHSHDLLDAGPVGPITLLGNRWVRLRSDSSIALATELARNLRAVGYSVVEADSGGHCRLSIDPSQLFFDALCFSYGWKVDEKKKKLMLTLKAIPTTFGTLPARSIEIPLAVNFVRDLVAVERGESPTDNFEREARRHFLPARRLGFRKFHEVTQGIPEIVIPTSDSS